MKNFAKDQSDLRPADEVMRLSRMGAMFPSRLSFLRTLTRSLIADGSQVSRPHWQIDGDGYGTAVYTGRWAGTATRSLPSPSRLTLICALTG